MKALEILYVIQDKVSASNKKEVHEAIKELEVFIEWAYLKRDKVKELEDDMSCDGCEHESLYPTQPPCNLCIRQGTDLYAPKDSK